MNVFNSNCLGTSELSFKRISKHNVPSMTDTWTTCVAVTEDSMCFEFLNAFGDEFMVITGIFCLFVFWKQWGVVLIMGLSKSLRPKGEKMYQPYQPFSLKKMQQIHFVLQLYLSSEK